MEVDLKPPKKKDEEVRKRPRKTDFKGTSKSVYANKKADKYLMDYLTKTKQITVTQKQFSSPNLNQILQNKINRMLIKNKKIKYNKREMGINELRDKKIKLYLTDVN